MNGFSFRRFLAVLRKEWIQVRRDPFTLRMIVALPVLQLILFGYAINANPRHLPTGLLSADHSRYERTIIAALNNTGYYDIRELSSEAEAERGLADGELLFVVNIPPNFARSVDRGDKPSILMDADGTDPSAIGNAAAALASLTTALDRDLPPAVRSQPASMPFQFQIHARYNPEQLTVLNIVPGLICMVLTISTLFVTTLSITRETERGTMENLLAMPVRPIEVMIAKIVPYIVIGYVQVLLIVALATVVFGLPIRGSIPLLSMALGLFIASNLALGVTFSTVARNQDAGDPDGTVHAVAVLHAFGIYVSVSGHADLGAMGRRVVPDHPCAAHRARHIAERRRPGRYHAGSVADRCVHAAGHGRSDLELSRNAGLTGLNQALQPQQTECCHGGSVLDFAISDHGFDLGEQKRTGY